MFRPVKMAKVRAVCLKAAAPSVIGALQNLSAMHIKDTHLPHIERSGPLATYDEISSRLIKIRSMKEAFGKTGRLPKRKLEIEKPLALADGLLEEYDALFSLIAAKEALLRELDANLSSQRSLADLQGLNVDFSKLPSSALQFILLKANADKAKQTAKELSRKKNFAFAASEPNGSSQMLLVALPKSSDIKELERFGQVSALPLLSSTPGHAVSELQEKEAKIREKIEASQKRIDNFSNVHYPRLAAAEEALSIEADRAQIATQFGVSSSLYYIEGWVEESKFNALQQHLKEKFGKKVMVSRAPTGHHEQPPTKLSNPAIAGPFQFVVDFLSTTGYSEIDPSIILFFAIPLIYALIFGDAGYAVFSFIMSYAMVKKSKKGSLLNQVASIWMISAIPAFFMGIIFDEFFGFTHGHLLSLFGVHAQFYEGLHRVSSITTLMFICILIGMVHIGLGFILGAINEWNHSKKHAIAKLCWLGIEISGFFLVAAGMFSAFPMLLMPALLLFLVSVAGLVMTEGPIAAVEIPGLASNIMSYIRIAAVGVGGVILAEAINELLLPKFDASPVGIIVFLLTLIIYIAVHAVSCLLAMFESFIHGARLNVVEFFGKFYKGNGVRFNPFSAKRLYTQEI